MSPANHSSLFPPPLLSSPSTHSTGLSTSTHLLHQRPRPNRARPNRTKTQRNSIVANPPPTNLPAYLPQAASTSILTSTTCIRHQNYTTPKTISRYYLILHLATRLPRHRHRYQHQHRHRHRHRLDFLRSASPPPLSYRSCAHPPANRASLLSTACISL